MNEGARAVFISYASQDVEAAQRIAALLSRLEADARCPALLKRIGLPPVAQDD